MSPILSTLLFVATAAAQSAQVTTSIWMPSGFGADEVGFYGSVIDSDGDRVTLAIVYDEDTDTSAIGVYENVPETVTVGPTWFESVVTTTDLFDESDITVSLACEMATRSRAKPTCTYSMGGSDMFDTYCSDYSTYTDIVTETYQYTYTAEGTFPASTETVIETYDYAEFIPEYCTEGSTLPESIAVDTLTLSRSYVETYQVIITAGAEKLEATARSSASGSGASETGTGTAAGNSNPSGTAGAPAENTGAAAPMITMAPALAGLGAAAMAAFVL